MVIFGRTNWKWLVILLGLILLIIGGIIVYSFITGTTWQITTFIIEIPPKFGYLSVTQSEVDYYNRLGQEATNQFLKDGILRVDDASGLSYTDRNGNLVTGTLTKAETGSKYLIIVAMLFAFISLINLFFKSLVDKKTRTTRYKFINKSLNWAGILSVSLTIILVIYFVIRGFIG
jgi:hypothetical protein